jgi:hypothetical protein
MDSFPFSKDSCNSILRCPSRALVSTARAWSCWVFSGVDVKWLAYMLTVKLSRVDKSGNYAANARKSTGTRAGISGGMS